MRVLSPDYSAKPCLNSFLEYFIVPQNAAAVVVIESSRHHHHHRLSVCVYVIVCRHSSSFLFFLCACVCSARFVFLSLLVTIASSHIVSAFENSTTITTTTIFYLFVGFCFSFTHTHTHAHLLFPRFFFFCQHACFSLFVCFGSSLFFFVCAARSRARASFLSLSDPHTHFFFSKDDIKQKERKE